MIPLLFWLDAEAGSRRHARKNAKVLSQAFRDAWRSYKAEAKSPFRSNILSFESVPSKEPVLRKCRLAIEDAPTFIYIYIGKNTRIVRSRRIVSLSGGGRLDLQELLQEIDRLAEFNTVAFIDAPYMEASMFAPVNNKFTLCWRVAKDFVASDRDGCDPFLGSFARLYGAAVRNFPAFTLKEILKAAANVVEIDFEASTEIYRCVGSGVALDNAALNTRVVRSEVTKGELENLSSKNKGSFEDGLQALTEALDHPATRSDATDLAFLFSSSARYKFVGKQVELFLGKDSREAKHDLRRTSAAPRSIVEEILSDLVTIPSGVGLIGSDPSSDPYALYQEIPQHRVSYLEFQIGRHQVRASTWLSYLDSVGQNLDSSSLHPDHPITYVSFFDVLGFLAWLERGARVHSLIEPDSFFTLPSEVEWEIAARGKQGFIYPWGNSFRPYCNFRDNSNDELRDVGFFSPDGDSPYGLADMAGNAWDWTRSLWGRSGRMPEFRYPYRWNDGRENLLASKHVRRVIRGGAYYYFDWCLRCATRNVMFPETRHSGGSFRVMKSFGTGSDVRPV
jgi:formylglycine-generating enzyme required for sulfatase activity